MADLGMPDVRDTTEGLDDGAQKFGDRKVKKGPLLIDYDERADEKKLARRHLKMWKAQDKLLERAQAQWGVNAARRAGINNARVRYNSVDEHWTAWMPKNATPDTAPDVNKAASLCRRMTSQMFIDPFIGQVVAPEGDDEDAAAAELSDRALGDLQAEHGLNSSSKGRRAFDRCHTYGSGYEWFKVDAHGGGQRPVRIEARADAVNASLAFVDPLTGEEGPQMEEVGLDEFGAPIRQPAPFVERFIGEDGEFVESEKDAAIEYLPALRSEVLDSRYVRLLPHTACDIWEAQGVMIAAMPTWAEVKRMAPDIVKLPEEDIKNILGYRPAFSDDLIPGGDDQPQKLDGDVWNDERRVFVLTSYHLRDAEYEDGLYLITIGGEFVFHRSDWVDKSDEPSRALDLPLTQYYAFDEGRDGYHKVGLMELLGPGNEVRAAQIAGLLDHLDRFNRQHTFVPTNSIIEPEDLAKPRGAMIPINPGGEPFQLPIPPWPGDSYSVYQEMAMSMDEAAGLGERSGGGTPAENARSGRQAFAAISEVHAGLAEPRQNVERAFVRGSRITLQLARAFFEEEQEAKWGGEGGRYRTQAWRGADLVDNPDVRVMPGSGSMLAPAAKAQLAERYASLGIFTPDQLKDVITSNVGGTIGLQDDPHRLRIRSQLAEYMEGPPEGWQPPPNGMTVTPPSVDPMTGQQVPGQIVDELLARMWDPVAADKVPQVAALRLKEIGDAMANPKFTAFPPPWRMVLDYEFEQMGAALAPAAPLPPGEGGEEGLPGDMPLNADGTPLNDLQEDAFQEGAPPEMIV